MMIELPRSFRALRCTAFLLCMLASFAFSQTPDAATKFRLAQSLEQAGESERASALYSELLAKDPSNYMYFDGVQRTLLALKRYDDAISLITTRLNKTPEDLNLRTLLGSVLYRSGREKEADQAWDRAVAFASTNPGTYRLVASTMIENRLLERAVATYRRGREACGDPGLFTIELAQLLVATMDYKGASQEYLWWVGQNPAQLSFVQNRMAVFSWKPEGREAAIEVVRAAVEKEEDVRLYELLGWLYMEGKDFAGAFDVYQVIDRLSGSNGTGLFAFAQRAFRERAYDLSAKAYQAALDAPLPASRRAAAMYGFATSLKELAAVPDSAMADKPDRPLPAPEARPQFAGVIASYRKVIQRYPHTEFAARSYLQIGLLQFEKDFDLDGALASFDRVRDENPGVAAITNDVALKAGLVLTARGDTAAAMARYLAVAKAPAAAPDQSDEANFRVAELEYFRGDFAGAMQRLDSLSLNLKADYANDALALRSFLQENSATAQQGLIEFARADYLARQKKNTEAIAILQNIVQKYPQAYLVDDALMKAASFQAGSGLYREAIASYETLLSTFKESSVSLDRARFRMGEVYELGLKDATNAIACYEKVLADYPQSVLTDQARNRIRRLRGDLR